MKFQKGAIVDVYEERKPAYRGCILEPENSAGQAYVCNLTTGRSQWQCNQCCCGKQNHIMQLLFGQHFTYEIMNAVSCCQ